MINNLPIGGVTRSSKTTITVRNSETVSNPRHRYRKTTKITETTEYYIEAPSSSDSEWDEVLHDGEAKVLGFRNARPHRHVSRPPHSHPRRREWLITKQLNEQPAPTRLRDTHECPNLTTDRIHLRIPDAAVSLWWPPVPQAVSQYLYTHTWCWTCSTTTIRYIQSVSHSKDHFKAEMEALGMQKRHAGYVYRLLLDCEGASTVEEGGSILYEG